MYVWNKLILVVTIILTMNHLIKNVSNLIKNKCSMLKTILLNAKISIPHFIAESLIYEKKKPIFDSEFNGLAVKA